MNFFNGPEDAFAQAPGRLPNAEACLAANRSLSLGAPLPRTTARLNAGEPVRIIAIGSSSTTGLWMLSPSATYPEVMRRELAGCAQPHASRSTTAAASVTL